MPLNKGKRTLVGALPGMTSASAGLRAAMSLSRTTDGVGETVVEPGADWAATGVATTRFTIRHKAMSHR